MPSEPCGLHNDGDFPHAHSALILYAIPGGRVVLPFNQKEYDQCLQVLCLADLA